MAKPTATSDPLSDPTVQALKKDWPSLDARARGNRLLPLARQYSKRKLASALEVSDKLVRNSLLRTLPRPSEQASLDRYGTKKQLRTIRAGRAQRARWEELLSGSSRRRFRAKLARTLEQWFKDNVPPPQWDLLFDMLLHPYTPGLADIWVKNFCRDPSKIALEGDWDAVIAETRPPEPVGPNPLAGYYRATDPIPPSLDAFHDFLLEWLSRWYNRCVPDGKLQKSVLEDVRKRLRRHARKKYPKALWEVGG